MLRVERVANSVENGHLKKSEQNGDTEKIDTRPTLSLMFFLSLLTTPSDASSCFLISLFTASSLSSIKGRNSSNNNNVWDAVIDVRWFQSFCCFFKEILSHKLLSRFLLTLPFCLWVGFLFVAWGSTKTQVLILKGEKESRKARRDNEEKERRKKRLEEEETHLGR